MHEVVYRKALQHRQVFLWGEIDHDLAYDIVNEISFLKQISKAPIIISINSDGGDLDATFAIIDEILGVQYEGINVYTIAAGPAYSGGAGILAMGTKGLRFVRPNQTVMLHPVSYGLPHDYEGNSRALMHHYDKQTERYNKMIAKACGKSRKYKQFLKDIDKGLWLQAEEAIAYGIVDYMLLGPHPAIVGEKNAKKSN
jgi:ATP-dependent Clp protease protease subunit